MNRYAKLEENSNIINMTEEELKALALKQMKTYLCFADMGGFETEWCSMPDEVLLKNLPSLNMAKGILNYLIQEDINEGITGDSPATVAFFELTMTIYFLEKRRNER